MRIATLLLLFAVALLVPLAGFKLMAQEQTAKSFVERMLQDMLAAEGRSVAIDGLSIGLTGDVTASRIEVRDGADAWLVLEGFTLDWQPLSLLSRSLAIDSIAIDRIDLRRLPRSEEGGVAAPKEAGELTAAGIKRIAVGTLRIAPALAGEKTTLKLEGSAEIKQAPPEIRLDLDADRTDGKQGRLSAAIILDPRTRQLTIDIALSEQADGLVAGLLNVAGDPSVDLTLSARGSIDNWSGDFGLDLNKQRVLGGRAEAASDASGQTLSIDAGGSVGRLVPAALQPFFAGDSQLVAAVTYHDDGRVDVQRIRLDSETFQMRASGPIDWLGSGSDLSVELRSKADDRAVLVPGLPGIGSAAIAGLSADVSLRGPLTAPRWSVAAGARSIETEQALIGDPSVSLAGTGLMPAERPVAIVGSAKGTLAQGVASVLPPLLLGPFDGRLAGAWQQDGSLRLGQVQTKIGALDLSGTGMVNTQTGGFDLTANVTTESPSTGVEMIDRILHGPVAAEGRFTGDGAGGIGLEDVRLTSQAIEAAIDGRLADDIVDLSFSTGFDDLARLHAEMGGSARIAGTLKGPRRAPEAVIDANGENVTLLGRPFGEPRLEARLVLDAAKPRGEISLTGLLDAKPVRLAARIETEADGTRVVRDVVASSGSARAAGHLRLPPAGNPAGQLTFSVPDLEDVAPFVLTRLSGSLDGRIDVDAGEAEGRMRVEATGRAIVSDAFSAQALDAQFAIAAPFTQPRPEGRLSLTRARAAGLSFAAIDIQARSIGERTYRLLLNAAGDDLSAKGEADVAMRDGGATIRLARLTGRTRGIPFQAARPFTVSLDGQELRVDGAALGIGGGRATLSGLLAPRLDAQATLTALPLSALAQAASLPGLGGSLSGDLRLTGTLAEPGGRFELSGNGITFEQLQVQGLRPLALKASGTIANDKITLSGSGTSGPDLAATVEGDIGLSQPARLDVSVRGQAGRRVFADRLAQRGIRLEGDARFDLRIAGSVGDPALSGALSIAGMTFGDTGGSFIVRNGSGRATIANNVLRIVSLQGTTGRKGRASLSGTVALGGSQAVDLRARIENGIYSDGTLVTTRYNADLALRGPLAGTPVLSGDISLRDAKVTLSEIPPSALTPLDVKHVRAPAKVRKQAAVIAERGSGAAANVALDITLRAGNPISVSGRGLNVVLGGRLQVTGTLGSPVASGAFRLRRGSLKLLARRLEFESGRLDFNDDLDPTVNLVAVSRRTDATITLTVSGHASAPTITVTSSPQMPQEEALARLMFDRSMLQLSPLQLAQIASSIATLSGGSDSGLLTRLQAALGVDWLEVTETEAGETAIGIGKRVNDKLSVGVEQTTRTNTSRVIIDLNLTRNLKARGALGTDGSSRAGVVFEKDY